MRRFINFIVTAVLLVVAWLVGMVLVHWVFAFLGAIATLGLFIGGVLILAWWITRGTGKKKPDPQHDYPVGRS